MVSACDSVDRYDIVEIGLSQAKQIVICSSNFDKISSLKAESHGGDTPIAAGSHENAASLPRSR